MQSLSILSSLLMIGEVPKPRDGLSGLDFVSVVIYLLVTLGIVLWASRRQKTTDDFFLGNRRMPWMAVGLSIMATLLSAISYVGVPGEMIKSGITVFSGYLAIPFTMMVIFGLWVPFFMRLRLTSAYEYLELRFDYRTRLLGSFLFLLLRLGWISMVMYTGSLALGGMMQSLIPEEQLDPLLAWWQGSADAAAPGVPLWRNTFTYWVIISIGLAATVYTYLGGIRAVIWNDVLQFLMLFSGAALILIYISWTTGTGPLYWWQNVSNNSPQHTSPILFSWDVTERTTIVTAMIHSFFWAICTHASDQVVLQRYFSTTSLKSARRSYLVNALTDFLIMSLLAVAGLALFSFYLDQPTYLPKEMLELKAADRIMPHFFAHQLPAGLGGLLLATFLCDAMQTLDAGVNSIAAVATKDLCERLYPQGSKIFNELNLARMLTVFIGLLVVCLACTLAYFARQSGKNIIELMPRSFNMYLGPLASLFFIGMFVPRATARSTIPAVLLGMAVSIVWSYWEQIVFLLKTRAPTFIWNFWEMIFPSMEDRSPTFTLAIAAPCVISVLTAAILSLLIEKGGEHPGRAYTWFAILRRPVPEATKPE